MNAQRYYAFEPFYADMHPPMTILRIIVPIIATWCVRYEAELLHPNIEGKRTQWRTRPEWKQSGSLDTYNDADIPQWLESIITWFTDESITGTGNHEKLYLYDAAGHAIGQFNEDITINWGIELTQTQYQQAQQQWIAQGFPPDLFNDDDPVCTPVDHFVLGILGFKKYMSKKQWEQQQ